MVMMVLLVIVRVEVVVVVTVIGVVMLLVILWGQHSCSGDGDIGGGGGDRGGVSGCSGDSGDMSYGGSDSGGQSCSGGLSRMRGWSTNGGSKNQIVHKYKVERPSTTIHTPTISLPLHPSFCLIPNNPLHLAKNLDGKKSGVDGLRYNLMQWSLSQ